MYSFFMSQAVNVYNKKSVGDFPTDLFIHNISIPHVIDSLNLIDNYRETLLSTLIGNLNLYPLYSKLIVDIVFPS